MGRLIFVLAPCLTVSAWLSSCGFKPETVDHRSTQPFELKVDEHKEIALVEQETAVHLPVAVLIQDSVRGADSLVESVGVSARVVPGSTCADKLASADYGKPEIVHEQGYWKALSDIKFELLERDRLNLPITCELELSSTLDNPKAARTTRQVVSVRLVKA